MSFANAVVNRISYTTTGSGAMSAGESRNYTFALDEPIICPDASVTCEVRLNLSNSSPSTITLSSSTLVWGSAEWAQTRTLTLTVNSNITYLNNATVTISSSATSNAEYYRNYQVTLTQAVNLPASPAQIAAAERAAAELAAQLRQIEVDNFRTKLFQKLVKGIRPAYREYSDAVFPEISNRTFEKVTDELFLLEPIKRQSAERIELISNKLAFEDDFFSLDIRPNVSTFQRYSILGVNIRTISKVNERILSIPNTDRNRDQAIELIKLIVKEENFVDLFSNEATLQQQNPEILIKMGLIPKDSRHKFTILSGLKSRGSVNLNSLSKIAKAVEEEIAKVQARKDRLIKVKQRINNRSLGS